MADDPHVTPLRLGSQRLYDTEDRAHEPSPDPDDKFFGITRPAPPPQTSTHVPHAAAGRTKDITSTVLELTGITALTTGCYLIAPYVGLIVAGLCLILLGAALGVR